MEFNYNNIKMNNKEINTTVIYNLLLMIKRRGDLENHSSTFDKIKPQSSTDITFTINGIKNKYNVYIVNGKLNSITSKSNLDDYLSKKIDEVKILVVRSPSKRAVKQILGNYSNTEFFFEQEFLEDIPSKDFIPKHSVLSDEDKNFLLEKINMNELSDIYDTDIMARYYKAKVNDIMKIIRPNLTCGESTFYRKVIEGNLNNFLP